MAFGCPATGFLISRSCAAPPPIAGLSAAGSGGELGQAYLPNQAPNAAGVLGAPSPGPVASLAPCTVTGQAMPAANVVTYTCAPTAPDTITRGVVVVGPFPQGYKVLQATLPASQSTMLQAILDSLPRNG